jgi:hypothetical protein
MKLKKNMAQGNRLTFLSLLPSFAIKCHQNNALMASISVIIFPGCPNIATMPSGFMKNQGPRTEKILTWWQWQYPDNPPNSLRILLPSRFLEEALDNYIISKILLIILMVYITFFFRIMKPNLPSKTS